MVFKNKLFWKIFISYVTLLCICLSLTGYFVVKITKGRHLDLITKHLESDTSLVSHLVLYILITFAITLAIGFIIIKINTSPLINITQIAQSFARGNFARKAEIGSSDEMGALAKAINTMGTELQSKIQTILDDKNKLDAIMDNMNDAIILNERVLGFNGRSWEGTSLLIQLKARTRSSFGEIYGD